MADMFRAQIEALISIDDLEIDADDIKHQIRERVIDTVMRRVIGTAVYERYCNKLAAEIIVKLTEDDDAHQ